ncbi:hypothetical protein L6452_09074 [Arctium lappa]|uniref:Uncharacterized protein n=1 Tax=Arctium lappa TaxID=4217 RepID=A0ACB9DK67_ARCLA|nr:hypothetical protein L6452_09074 [Arctium lappa]
MEHIKHHNSQEHNRTKPFDSAKSNTANCLHTRAFPSESDLPALPFLSPDREIEGNIAFYVVDFTFLFRNW